MQFSLQALRVCCARPGGTFNLPGERWFTWGRQSGSALHSQILIGRLALISGLRPCQAWQMLRQVLESLVDR